MIDRKRSAFLIQDWRSTVRLRRLDSQLHREIRANAEQITELRKQLESLRVQHLALLKYIDAREE